MYLTVLGVCCFVKAHEHPSAKVGELLMSSGMTSLVAEVPRDEIIATVCMHAASGSGLSQNKASGIFLQQYKSDTQKSALVAGSPGLTLSQGKAWDISVSSTGVPVLLKRSASSVSTAQVKAQEKSYMEHSSRSS